MGYDATSDLLFNRKLSHFEVRLYQIIRNLCNSDGYSEVKNQTLANFFGEIKKDVNGNVINKDVSHTQKAINNLVKHGYIVKHEHVKTNDVYPRNIDRVLWVKDAWLTYQDNKKKDRAFKAKATPKTDWKCFVQHLKNNPNFPYHIKRTGGAIEEYRINPIDGNLWCHSGLSPSPLRKENSKKIFDILFANRFDVLDDPTKLVVEELTEDQKTITELMNELALLKRI